MMELRERLVSLGRDTWGTIVRGPGAVLSFAALVLLLWQYYGYPATYRASFEELAGPWRYQPIAPSLYWFVSDLVMLLGIPFLVARTLWRRSVRELGFGLGDWRLGMTAALLLSAVMVPIAVYVAAWPEFRATYPLDPNALRSHELFWVYEAGYAGFFVGWEFFFRGFLLFSLEPSLGPLAIGVQMVPFALMHVGKPVAETLGSIVAGMFLGVLAWRTRSIWYGVILHAVVALAMDITVYVRWGLIP